MELEEAVKEMAMKEGHRLRRIWRMGGEEEEEVTGERREERKRKLNSCNRKFCIDKSELTGIFIRPRT